MKIQDQLTNNFFEVHYIIHEKEDNAVLLNGAYIINNKKYFTDIPLDFLNDVFIRIVEVPKLP